MGCDSCVRTDDDDDDKNKVSCAQLGSAATDRVVGAALLRPVGLQQGIFRLGSGKLVGASFARSSQSSAAEVSGGAEFAFAGLAQFAIASAPADPIEARRS